jgi:uracil-DNA glycosylase
VVALGSFAWDGAIRAIGDFGYVASPKPGFTHLAEARVGPFTLLGSYHPSQQNTFTGRLTPAMLDEVMVVAGTRVSDSPVLGLRSRRIIDRGQPR